MNQQTDMEPFKNNLMEFHKFWFQQQKHWFSQSNHFDFLILSKFESLLDYEKLNELYFSMKQTYGLQERVPYVSAVLVCDQLIRHKFREENESSLVIVRKFTQLAAKFSDKIERTILFYYSTPVEQCFILIPWRHLGNIPKMNESISILKNNEDITNASIYRRFYKATMKKLTQLNTINQMKKPVKNEEYKEDYKVVLDKRRPCDNIHPYDSPKDDEDIIRDLKEFVIDYGISRITVSLSGGVDSMVLLYALNAIKEDFSLDIRVVHINYNNRWSSKLESELCSYFCNLIGVPCYVRNITEITRDGNRDKKNREYYENITKEIRFHCYELLKYDVFLGHNQDDVVENIFANIIKKKNYDNLEGMNYKSNFDKFYICRPFLDITKKEMYEFADKYKIPYVYDSTPDWSERGQKRDKLIPFLNEFDSRIIKGLLDYAHYTSVISRVNKNAIKACVEFPIDCMFDTEDIKEPTTIAIIKDTVLDDYQQWKIAINYVCKNFNLPYISQKGCKNSYHLIEMTFSKKYNLSKMITLNKNLVCIRTEETIIVSYMNLE